MQWSVAAIEDQVTKLSKVLDNFQKDREALHALITNLQGQREEEKRINLEIAKLVTTRLDAMRGLYNW